MQIGFARSRHLRSARIGRGSRLTRPVSYAPTRRLACACIVPSPLRLATPRMEPRFTRRIARGCHDSGASRVPEPPGVSGSGFRGTYPAGARERHHDDDGSAPHRCPNGTPSPNFWPPSRSAASRRPFLRRRRFCGGDRAAFRTSLWPALTGTAGSSGYWPTGAFNLPRWPASPQLMLPRLRLKWAFGFPGDIVAYTRCRRVAGGTPLRGEDAGRRVYSLSASTGCIYWTLEAEAPVRTAISIIGRLGSGSTRLYFGDLHANAYAVDAANGKLIWKARSGGSLLKRASRARRCSKEIGSMFRWHLLRR